MTAPKSSFLDKVLGRIGRMDQEGLQTVVQRLARERSFLDTLFNTIEDGVLVVDESGRILYLNNAITRLLGLQRQDAEGEPVARFVPELDWDKIIAVDRSGGRKILRHEFEVHYPRERYLHLYVAPLDGEAAGSSGLALILHDATEARQRTHEAIETERVQALTLLAASVAHEIGNPLNALHIHLQLMERELKKLRASLAGPSPASRKVRSNSVDSDRVESVDKLEEFLAVGKGEITRLDYIVTQFLQAIRPSPPQLQPASLNDITRETIELLRPEIENRGITIKAKFDRHLPLAPLDPAQIKQVLVNLMKNASQAMSSGGTLTLRTIVGIDGVVLTVADTGGGIPEEQLNRIFEPFYTTKQKGSGLGLMIVQRIVREHKGRIDLESHVGQGTAFHLWLPLLKKTTKQIGQGSTDAKELEAGEVPRSQQPND